MAGQQQKTDNAGPHVLLTGCVHVSEPAPDWVQALRATASDSFEATGLPTPAWEDWKYTSLRALDQTVFSRDVSLQAVPDYVSPFAELNGLNLQMVAGRLVAGADVLPEGLEILPLKDAWEQDWVQHYLAVPGNYADTPMEALNAACLCEGAVFRVKAGTKIETPVILSSVHENSKDMQATMPRILIVMEEGADMTLVEHHTGQGRYLTNHVETIVVQKDAVLNHYRWQNEDREEAYHITTTRLTCFDNAVYDSCTVTTGGRLSRHEIYADLLGTDIKCILNGAYRLKGNQHFDTTIKMGHFEPQSISKQIYKGVMNDQARAVFQGKIHVHRHAQGTDGHQLNHALLLSEQAEVDVKPELEIYADDVKCAHGATAGKLDDKALFYLRSRGIPEKTAQDMLVEGFLGEALEAIAHDGVRQAFLSIQQDEAHK